MPKRKRIATLSDRAMYPSELSGLNVINSKLAKSERSRSVRKGRDAIMKAALKKFKQASDKYVFGKETDVPKIMDIKKTTRKLKKS